MHRLAEFGRALTVETAVEQLVWAHAHAPEGVREVAMEYVVANCRAIQVGRVRVGRCRVFATCSTSHFASRCPPGRDACLTLETCDAV